jgi:hypothetical protein
MSRINDHAPVTVAGRELSPDEQAERAKYSTIPNIPGMDGAVSFVAEKFEIDVSEHMLRRAITQRRLARHEIGHALYFSARDLYDFIVLGTRKTTGRKEMNQAKASA